MYRDYNMCKRDAALQYLEEKDVDKLQHERSMRSDMLIILPHLKLHHSVIHCSKWLFSNCCDIS